MCNEEYLEKCKECRDNEVKEFGRTEPSPDMERIKIELRKVYALEIIAETLIRISGSLENIDNNVTAIKNLQ